jgi:hypothetical protein
MKAYGGWMYKSYFYLGTSWGWVASFTPRPLYPRYPFGRRLGGPQSRSGRRTGEKVLDPTGTRALTPSSSGPLTSRCTDYALNAKRKYICLNELLGDTDFVHGTMWCPIRNTTNINSNTTNYYPKIRWKLRESPFAALIRPRHALCSRPYGKKFLCISECPTAHATNIPSKNWYNYLLMIYIPVYMTDR